MLYTLTTNEGESIIDTSEPVLRAAMYEYIKAKRKANPHMAVSVILFCWTPCCVLSWHGMKRMAKEGKVCGTVPVMMHPYRPRKKSKKE